MFAEMCVVWQESQPCLPCRLAETGFKNNGEGRCRVRCSQQEGLFLPSCIRLGSQAGKLARTAHQSQSCCTSSTPHHIHQHFSTTRCILVLQPCHSSAWDDRRDLLSPRLQVNQAEVKDPGQDRMRFSHPGWFDCFTAIQAKDAERSTHISAVLSCYTHLTYTCLNPEIETLIDIKMQ
jgi:hypothetical protein